MANDPLEGFHEVNLASPTSPDLLAVYEPGTQEQTTSPSVIYRPHPSALCATPIQANALDVSDLPTQPVYSSPRRLNCAEISSGSIHGTDPAPCSTSGVTAGLLKLTTRKDNCSAEREFLQGATVTEACDGSEDIFGLSTDSLSRLRSPSVLEVREKGYERLKEELAKAQRELKLKDEECERLSKVRDQLGQELEELTASLFEEAHKMVREANVKQATAEKQLKEAQGKIDVLQAEVAALKTLVLSSSPTSPTQEPLPGGKAHFKKGHTRNKSTSSAMSGSHQDLSVIQPIVKDCKEADLSLYNEFRSWKDEPTMDRTCPFLDKIYQEDIFPCLTFSKSELASAVLEAVENNTLSIEPVGLQPVRFVKASAVECGGPKVCAVQRPTRRQCGDFRCIVSGELFNYRPVRGIQDIHWRRKWQPTPVLLPGKSYGRRNLVGYSSRGRKESDFTSLTPYFITGEGNDNPLQYSCLENPMNRGAWRAVVHGVAESRTRLKKCALTGQSKSCKHRIKLGDSSNYYYISPFCRYRITSVCNFFTYIRYIQQGLVKQQDVDQMFWEVMQLRKEMSLAKLGYFKEEL